MQVSVERKKMRKTEMSNTEIKTKIEKEFRKKKQVFGRGEFYQSFPMIELEGQRPTDRRLEEYGVMDILNKNQTVLDIGCNCGFLDMTIAKKVKSVTGIEYNKKLVKIAKKVSKYLNIDNVKFVATDYNKWEKKAKDTYDVICSFAVHYWLQVTPITYTKRLYELLNPGGYIFFESQNLETVDQEFDEYCKEFVKLGMTVVKDGTIKDDDVIERRYLVFKK